MSRDLGQTKKYSVVGWTAQSLRQAVAEGWADCSRLVRGPATETRPSPNRRCNSRRLQLCPVNDEPVMMTMMMMHLIITNSIQYPVRLPSSRIQLHKVKVKAKKHIAVCTQACDHRYGTSHAIWDHTVLHANRQRWHSRLYPSRSWYSI